jgi:hypothetical protein
MKDAPTLDYILDNDIDLTGVVWEPIGHGGAEFSGSFDGQNFTIRNLTCTDNAVGAAGLFGYVGDDSGMGKNGVISNLNIENVVLTGNYAMGGLVGFIIGATISNVHITNITINWDTLFDLESAGGLGGDCYNISGLITEISNCSVDGINCNVANNLVGGLLGDCFGFNVVTDFVISNCSVINGNLAGVSQSGNHPMSLAGFIGDCEICTIIDSYSEVNISISTIDSVNFISGFIGYGDTINISGCHSTGSIIITSDGNCLSVAGIIGEMYSSTVTNCYSIGSINITTSAGSIYSVGGGIGYSESSTITNCYSEIGITCSMSGSTNYYGIAGFIGQSFASNIISLCHATGNVNCSGGLANYGIGGFSGQFADSSSCYHSYCTGNVEFNSPSGGNAGLGGFTGQFFNAGTIIHDCYAHGNVLGIFAGTGATGGFVGQFADGIIRNCYCKGTVDGPGEIGGFCGEFLDNLGLVNCYSVGVVTKTSGTDPIGGFIGSLDCSFAPIITNCSWWTGAHSHAVGRNEFIFSVPVDQDLAPNGWGTDEPDNTKFYTADHAVYTGVTPWDITQL